MIWMLMIAFIFGCFQFVISTHSDLPEKNLCCRENRPTKYRRLNNGLCINSAIPVTTRAISLNSPSHKQNESTLCSPENASNLKIRQLTVSFFTKLSNLYFAISSRFLPYNSAGLQVAITNAQLSILFDGSKIPPDQITGHLDLIYLFGLSYPVYKLSLSNLSISKFDGEIIDKIINEHSKLKHFSIRDCNFEDENEFCTDLPNLSLTYLELTNCSVVVERILKRLDSTSLESLKLTGNKMKMNFYDLTRLLDTFININCLIINNNSIDPSCFEFFYVYISQLPKLTELCLINDGVNEPFIKLLSEGDFITIKILRLAQQKTGPTIFNNEKLMKVVGYGLLCIQYAVL